MVQDRAAAEAYLDTLPDPRRGHMRHLHEVILEALPGIDVGIVDYASSPVIGYGWYDYSNSKGPAGRWFSIGIASRKAYISLYSMASGDGGYLVESIVDRFPGATAGRSCLNIKKPELVPDAEVAALARMSWDQYKDGFHRPLR